MDGVVRRLPVKLADGSIDLIDVDGIFYLESNWSRVRPQNPVFRY